MMGSWVESVVDWMAIGRAQFCIVLHHRWPATIGKNKVVLRNQSTEWIPRIFFHSCQGRRRIYIPKSNFGLFRAVVEDFCLQQVVKNAHAAVLDNEITFTGGGEQRWNFWGVFVDDRGDIGKVTSVTLLLAAVGIRLSKNNLMPQRMQLFVNSTVVGGCSVPVGRGDAGTENKNFHFQYSSVARD